MDIYCWTGLSRNQIYIEFKPELNHIYEKLRVNPDDNIAFVVPIFTASAYDKNGFYQYYKNGCESCLTTKIVESDKFNFNSSSNAIQVLQLLGYKAISDIDIDQNPNIVQKYDKIILLHNEYVTKTIFDAITSHPKVIYLYPNALYAEISVNYESNTITLKRGHNFPEESITNGFDWEYDNTHPYEYDIQCSNWEFYEIVNGMMLNCYPEESLILENETFLKTIKEI